MSFTWKTEVILLLLSLLFMILTVVFDVIPLILLMTLVASVAIIRSFETDKLFYFVLLLIFVIPSKFSNTQFLPIYQNSLVMFSLFTLMFFLFFQKKIFSHETLILPRKHPEVSIFLMIIFFAALHSIAMGNDIIFFTKLIILYILFLSYYLFFDLFSHYPMKTTIRLGLRIMILTVLIIFVIYVLRVLFGETMNSSIGRIVSAYYYSFNFAFPLFMLIGFRSRQKSVRFYMLLLILSILFILLIGQARTFWVSISVQVLVMTLLLLFTEIKGPGIIFRRIIYLVIGTGVLFLAARWFILSNFDLERRLLTLSPELILWDPSLRHRIFAILAVINSVKDSWINWILGCGMGHTVDYYVFGTHYSDVFQIDNSYVSLIWNAGIPALIAYLLILLNQFRRGLFFIRHSNISWIKTYGLVTITFVIGFLISGITSTIFIGHRFNILWVAVWAFTDVLYDKLREGTSESEGDLSL